MKCKCCGSTLFLTMGSTGEAIGNYVGGVVYLCLANCSKDVKPKETK